MTRSMLHAVRDELRERIDHQSARIDETNARIDVLGHDLRGEIHALRAEIHGVRVLVEEQEARHRVVIEAVQGQTARIDRVEAGIEELRGTLHELFAFVRDQAKR